jgi:predicted ArsR family transcriptional regulator
VKFASPGAQRVARALHEGGPSTAADLAADLDLSAAVVRRHLEVLLAEGLVEAHERPPFGPAPKRGRGRPARVFGLTDRGAHIFDVAYDDLALSALRFLSEAALPASPGGAEVADTPATDPVAQFAMSRAAAWSSRYREAIRAADPGMDRVRLLVEVLNEEGYAATVVASDSGQAVQVCQHHCPVAHVAREFPQLCEAETHAFADVLGTHALRLATLAHGDGVCTTLVPLPSGHVHGSADTPGNDHARTASPDRHVTTTKEEVSA